jgi:hypothetical protein
MLYITLTTDNELLRAKCLELRAISSRLSLRLIRLWRKQAAFSPWH